MADFYEFLQRWQGAAPPQPPVFHAYASTAGEYLHVGFVSLLDVIYLHSGLQLKTFQVAILIGD